MEGTAGTVPFKSERVADFVADFDLRKAPAEVIDIAHTAFTDTMGTMLAGCVQPAAKIVQEVIAAEGAAPRASVVGRSLRTSPQYAAMANGLAAQALDFDFTFMIGQSAAALIPGLLPLGESLDSTPEEMVAAFIVGCEVCSRFARSYPTLSKGGGWHGAGLIGAVCSAAAFAKLAKVPRDKIPSIMGLSASMAAGLGANFGTMTKPFHPGLAARNGMLSMLLGAKGFTAAAHAIEGKNGFLKSFAKGEAWTADAFDDLGTHWDIVDPGYKLKPYACGGLLHTAIDAAVRLRPQVSQRLSGIRKIEIGVTQHTYDRAIDSYPWSADSARFSLLYLVAYSLVHHAPMFPAFTLEAIADPEVRRLADLSTVGVVEDFARFDGTGYSPGQVTVTLADGERLHEVVYYQSGTKEVPASKEQLKEKFFICATRVLRQDAASELYDYLQRFTLHKTSQDLWPLIATRD